MLIHIRYDYFGALGIHPYITNPWQEQHWWPTRQLSLPHVHVRQSPGSSGKASRGFLVDTLPCQWALWLTLCLANPGPLLIPVNVMMSCSLGAPAVPEEGWTFLAEWDPLVIALRVPGLSSPLVEVCGRPGWSSHRKRTHSKNVG